MPLPELLVVGRRDVWIAGDERASLEELIREEDRDKSILLLDHQPVESKNAEKAGVMLQLSGHAHAGQIWPASVLGRFLPLGDLLYGHRQRGGFHLIVSSGLGCRGSCLRSGCTAEYGIIDLIPGSAGSLKGRNA